MPTTTSASKVNSDAILVDNVILVDNAPKDGSNFALGTLGIDNGYSP